MGDDAAAQLRLELGWSPHDTRGFGHRRLVAQRDASGDIIAGKRVEIRPTAKVFGNLTTQVLVVHDGALFEGHCTMNAEVKEDRKVTPMVAKEERVVAQVAVGGNKA